MFQAVPPPIIRSSKLYTQHQVFVFFFFASYRYSEWVGTQFFRTSSGAQNCVQSIGYLSSFFFSFLVRSKKTRQIPNAVYTFLSSWWWAEEPPETCRTFIVINTTVWRCILLVMLEYMKHKSTLFLLILAPFLSQNFDQIQIVTLARIVTSSRAQNKYCQ
jgi:hypothetical protein